MNTITLPAHFDGTQIRLDVPFPLKRNARLIVTILPETGADDEHTTWQLLSAEGLNGAYGENEPEYATDLIKEVNVDIGSISAQRHQRLLKNLSDYLAP